MAQINFNISDELKARYDKAIEGSNTENKPEFFAELLTTFANNRANNIDTDIDFSKYQNVNSTTKEAVNSAFNHILSSIESNFSNAKQEAIYIDIEKKALIEKEESFNIELLKVTSSATKEMEELTIKTDDLLATEKQKSEQINTQFEDLKITNNTLEKELEQANKIANQLEYISTENKELREEKKSIISLNEKNKINNEALEKESAIKIDELEKTIFKTEFQAQNKDEKIAQIQDEKIALIEENKEVINQNKIDLKKITDDLIQVRAELNKALGKLETFENK